MPSTNFLTIIPPRATPSVGSYQLLRGLVPQVTWLRINCYEDTYQPLRAANDRRGRCQPSFRGMQWHGYKSRKGVAPFHGFALCVKSWCRIFPRTISGISDTNLSASPAQGRLKRSKIKKEKPNNGLSPILSKGRKVTINPIPTTSKGKAHLLTALNTARRDSLPLGRVGVGL